MYVDDLLAVMEDPKEFFDTLINTYKYKLKGVGPIHYHLGTDFRRDQEGTLYMSPKTYIQRFLENYSSTDLWGDAQEVFISNGEE